VSRSSAPVGERVEALDWKGASAQLDAQGWALLPKLLARDECEALAALYGDERRFRSRVVMARHGYGRGEYKYFGYPLPPLVAALRTALYPRLAPIANRWHEVLGSAVRFPAKHAAFKSPYRNLLPTRAGGTSFVLSSMGGMLHSLLDVTIAYSTGTPSLWDLCCGRVGTVIVDVRRRPIDAWMSAGDYANDPAFRERFLAERGRAALVQNTLEITVLESGGSTNVVPTEARAEIDARLLPGERCEAFVEEVRAAAATPGLELRILLDFESSTSPVGTELFRALERVAARSERPAVVVPRVISGFTDAHYFRALGIVAYGFVPRWLDPRDTRGIHGPNERISLENLTRGARVLVEVLEELDRR